MNRLAITRISKNGRTHTAYILLDGHRDFVDFQVSEPEGKSLLNNICIGRVEDVVPNIRAAFVRISKEQSCFLPLEDLEGAVFTKKISARKPLCVGDELLVQVVRDALKTKDPVVTAKLTLQGKCSVLTTGNTALSVSKKLPEEARKTYRGLLEKVVEDCTVMPDDSESRDGSSSDPGPRSFGIIIRTMAASYPLETVEEDLTALIGQYQTICRTAVHREAFQVLYKDPPFYISRLKSADLSKLDQITTDCEDIYDQIKTGCPSAVPLLTLYSDEKLSLHTLYNVEGSMEKLLASRVWLKSGANIIIEQLETLTVIDVNSAKNQSKKEAALLEVNVEAAREIARQLVLRNISGMILIDFINLKSKAEEQELIAILKEELKKDPIPCNFIDITKLGLVELTRKKVHKSLKEITS